MMVLIKLIVAHLLTDFVFQPTTWITSRNDKKFRSKALYLHGLITALVAWLLIGQWENWLLILLLFLAHTAIDLWKSYQEQTTKFFLIDQFLHMVTLIILVEIFHPLGILDLLQIKLAKMEYFLFLIGWISAVFPTGYYIALLTKKWQDEIEDTGLENAGRLIGWTERTLIFLLVISGNLTSVGFVLTAKSIFRYVDLKDTQDKKKTEYILIGTLLSFAFAVAIGLATLYILQDNGLLLSE